MIGDLTVDKKKELFKTMLLIRRVEEKLKEIFAQGIIPGFIHLSIGQEAVAAGVCANLRQDDYIVSTHRGHGHALAKGANLKKFMAELYGKADGFCKGHGGSMHIASKEHGILGSNGIVGAGIPIAAGAAFACKYKEIDRVTVCFFGEGATGTGAFHEGLNMASLLDLPILFCCETNHWAEFTPTKIHVKVKDVAERAKAYAIPSQVVNGDDVLEVYNVAGEMIKKIRQGGGPFFLECKTHRWEGHFAGDPQKYRPPEDIDESRKNCPLERLKAHLLSTESVGENFFKECEEEVKMQIDDAVKFAEGSPEPSPEGLLEKVYVSF